MIGRFMGAFALSGLGRVKNALVVAVPLVAFVLVALVGGWAVALHYGVFLALLLVAVTLGGSSAPRLLTLFAVIIIALLAVGMSASGEWEKWTVLAVGLFCSVMWSNIFSLAIEGLGSLKGQASSLLVMAILGGAVLPPLQGALADHVGVQNSFVVPIIAMAYVAFYGLYGYRAGRGRQTSTSP